jgi:hypothetical protein
MFPYGAMLRVAQFIAEVLWLPGSTVLMLTVATKRFHKSLD